MGFSMAINSHPIRKPGLLVGNPIFGSKTRQTLKNTIFWSKTSKPWKTPFFDKKPGFRVQPLFLVVFRPPPQNRPPRIYRKTQKTPFFDKKTPNPNGKTHFFRALGVPQEWHFLPFLPPFWGFPPLFDKKPLFFMIFRYSGVSIKNPVFWDKKRGCLLPPLKTSKVAPPGNCIFLSGMSRNYHSYY